MDNIFEGSITNMEDIASCLPSIHSALLVSQDPKFPKPYNWMGLDAFLVLAPTHLIKIMPSTLPCHLFRDGHTIQPKINSIISLQATTGLEMGACPGWSTQS